MIVKYNLTLIIAFFLLFFAFGAKTLFASSPEFLLHPEQGTIEKGKEFTIDILIDTKGLEVALARAVITFDPELVEVKSAQRNEDIFCDWPNNEQLVDNTNGIVMATGFCQSGAEQLYSTVAEPELFVRLTFVTIKAGSLMIDWEYSGRDEPRKSVMMQDGSPPQNVLTVKPTSRSYTIEEPKVVKTPETGIFISNSIGITLTVAGVIFLLALLVNVIFDPKRKYFNKSRTLVVHDDGKK